MCISRDSGDDYTGADYDDALDVLPPRKVDRMEVVHLPEPQSAENDAPALDRCTCTHWRTWHRNYDQSGNFVGVNGGACVADDCGCDRFRSERVVPPEGTANASS